MRRFRKLGAALVFAGFVASGMVAFSTTLHAAGPGTGAGAGYCKVLAVAIDKATEYGFTDLAAYLQSVYDANCS